MVLAGIIISIPKIILNVIPNGGRHTSFEIILSYIAIITFPLKPTFFKNTKKNNVRKKRTLKSLQNKTKKETKLNYRSAISEQ